MPPAPALVPVPGDLRWTTAPPTETAAIWPCTRASSPPAVAREHVSGALLGVGRYSTICSLDGDGQEPALEIHKARAGASTTGRAFPEGVALIAGSGSAARPPPSKRLASAGGQRPARVAPQGRDLLQRLRPEDDCCYVFALPYFDHMHRYLPCWWHMAGRRSTVDVAHAAACYGSGYANLGRAAVGAYDLVGVMWLIRRRKEGAPCSSEREGWSLGGKLRTPSGLNHWGGSWWTGGPQRAGDVLGPVSHPVDHVRSGPWRGCLIAFSGPSLAGDDPARLRDDRSRPPVFMLGRATALSATSGLSTAAQRSRCSTTARSGFGSAGIAALTFWRAAAPALRTAPTLTLHGRSTGSGVVAPVEGLAPEPVLRLVDVEVGAVEGQERHPPEGERRSCPRARSGTRGRQTARLAAWMSQRLRT